MTSNGKEVTRAMKHGRDSEFLKQIHKRIGESGLSQVDKLQLTSLADETTARGIMFDVDMFANSLLIEKTKEYGKKILTYESDLLRSQKDLVDIEGNIQFYKHELHALKEMVLNTTEMGEKDSLMARIYDFEKQINESQKIKNNTLKLRNDIRKEVDKKEFNEQKLKLEEQNIRGTAKIVDLDNLDMDALDAE